MGLWCHAGTHLWLLGTDGREPVQLAARVVRIEPGHVLLEIAEASRPLVKRLGPHRMLRIAVPRQGAHRTVGASPLLAADPDGAWITMALPELTWSEGVRAAMRVPWRQELKVMGPVDGHYRAVRGIDLSVRGILVETEAPNQVGSNCTVQLELPEGAIELQARVVRSRPGVMALEFVRVKGARYERLVRTVHRLLWLHPGRPPRDVSAS